MSYLSYYAKQTAEKLDKLQSIVIRCIESTEKISIPAIGRELGLGRQAVTYQLKLLERDRGVKIPHDRRCPQAKVPLKSSVMPSGGPEEPKTTNHTTKARASISGLPRASLGKWYMKDVFGPDNDTGEHISLTKEDLDF